MRIAMLVTVKNRLASIKISRKIPTTDIIGKGKDQISMADAPIEKVGEYACEDADMTMRLKTILEKDQYGETFLSIQKFFYS